MMTIGGLLPIQRGISKCVFWEHFESSHKITDRDMPLMRMHNASTSEKEIFLAVMDAVLLLRRRLCDNDYFDLFFHVIHFCTIVYR